MQQPGLGPVQRVLPQNLDVFIIAQDPVNQSLQPKSAPKPAVQSYSPQKAPSYLQFAFPSYFGGKKK